MLPRDRITTTSNNFRDRYAVAQERNPPSSMGSKVVASHSSLGPAELEGRAPARPDNDYLKLLPGSLRGCLGLNLFPLMAHGSSF